MNSNHHIIHQKIMIIIGTDLNNNILWIYLVLIASEKMVLLQNLWVTTLLDKTLLLNLLLDIIPHCLFLGGPLLLLAKGQEW